MGQRCMQRAPSLPEEIVWKNTKPFVPPLTGGRVIKVYDGDTITVANYMPFPNSPLYRFSVRLRGIDCPEIKTKNPTEKELNDPYRLKPDTDGLKALEPGDIAGYPASKTGHSYAMSHLGNPRDRTRLDALRRAKQHHDLNYTDAEREAYFGGPYPLLAYGLNDPISRQGSEYYEPDKYEYELFDTDDPFDLAYNHLEQTTFKNYADLIPPDLKSRQL